MDERPCFNSLNLCSDHRFIRVISRDGAFYDLVPKWRSRAHVFALKQQFPHAVPVFRAHVPPCIFRDFTELNGPDIYREAQWRDGTDFFQPLTEEEKSLLPPTE